MVSSSSSEATAAVRFLDDFGAGVSSAAFFFDAPLTGVFVLEEAGVLTFLPVFCFFGVFVAFAFSS